MPKKKTAEFRKISPVMHIYCEGEKTEPNYINKYLEDKFPGDRRRNVIRVEPTKKNTPVQLVDEAVSAKKSGKYPPRDVFWVVYDRESIVKYPDSLHKLAYDKAEKNNINVAISNICFEAWILLHLQESLAPYANYDDLIANSNLKSLLKKIGLNSYEKGAKDIYEFIKGGVADASDRAKIVNKNSLASAPAGKTRGYEIVPFTDVYLLLSAINEFE